MKEKIFKITHQHLDDGDIYVKTDMSKNMFMKLIKCIQIETYSIEETFDLSPQQMQDVLTQYNIKPFEIENCPKEMLDDDGYLEYVELDLYLIWESISVKVNEKHIKKFRNQMATRMIKDFIDEEMQCKEGVN